MTFDFNRGPGGTTAAMRHRRARRAGHGRIRGWDSLDTDFACEARQRFIFADGFWSGELRQWSATAPLEAALRRTCGANFAPAITCQATRRSGPAWRCYTSPRRVGWGAIAPPPTGSPSSRCSMTSFAVSRTARCRSKQRSDPADDRAGARALLSAWSAASARPMAIGGASAPPPCDARRILVDWARERQAAKRGSGQGLAAPTNRRWAWPVEWARTSASRTRPRGPRGRRGASGARAPRSRLGELVELCFFAGCSVEESAEPWAFGAHRQA
jgi:hypothetical protein